ncbi:MAG: DNA photolyase family protein [Deferribacterales bacterium]
MKHNISLFIFRRDLRLEDNTALIEALKNSREVIPCFILNDEQLLNNEYRSDNHLQFIFNTLIELNEHLKEKCSKLYIFHGKNNETVISSILNTIKIDAVYFNSDYTPYSINRDNRIKSLCRERGIDCYCYHDILITPPGTVIKDDKTPYTIFTPFLKKAKKLQVAKSNTNPYTNYYKKNIDIEQSIDIFEKILPLKNSNIFLKGGRKEAINLLKRIKNLSDYDKYRDFPAHQSTTLLSSHNKVGSISIREFYWTVAESLGKDSTIINELYWRDFFVHIIYHFPHVLGSAFHKKYNNIQWSYNETLFKLWCNGETGFPIVDAGMRELNTTGFMHNRVRMIVASFLTKDLHIDWRWGEKYFAQKLIDYDPAVNNGNWQWSASTGCDAVPYFRIFNPWTQQIKFDPDCIYIKKWIPELKDIPAKVIHNLEKNPLHIHQYPKPIVNHHQEATYSKEIFSKV